MFIRQIVKYKIIVTSLCCLFFWFGINGQTALEQAKFEIVDRTRAYVTQEIEMLDFADDKEGYWLFLPKGIETKQRKNVIVFIHGYGGYNPFIYGAWLKHLARQGHPIIYPRYQKKLYPPKTKKFVDNTVAGIKSAIIKLEELGYDKNLWTTLDYTVHSYGGVIAANIVSHQEDLAIPPAKNMLLCSPGSGPFKGCVIENYNILAEDVNLIIVTSEHDLTVGDKLGTQIFRTAVNTPNRVYLRQYACSDQKHKISAGHNECYALDMDFDNGIRNYTAKKALRVGKTDILDYNVYWKLMDELIEQGADMDLFQKDLKEWPLLEESGLKGLLIRRP